MKFNKYKEVNMRKISFGSLMLLVICFMAVLIPVGNDTSSVVAESNFREIIEEKSYCTATIEDKFAEDRILVVINKEETNKFKSYTAKSFFDIDCSKVENLTDSLSEKLQKQLKSEKIEIKENKSEIDKNDFRTILSIHLKKSGKQNVLDAIRKLEEREDVLSAEPDYTLFPETTNPNDSHYRNGSQWGLNGANGINTPGAWNVTGGSSSVLVGVIDTGINATHPDLVNRVNTGLSRDFSLSYPYTVSTVTDSGYHGTHVAGIIGAQGNNSIGITGVCQDIQLVSLKIYPNATYSNVAQQHESFASRLMMAIDYATAKDVLILNNSNGTDTWAGSSNTFNAMETAIRNYPGLFISSAGNAGKNNDNNSGRFPSNFRLPNLISVGAINSNGARATGWAGGQSSNYGKNSVDIYAPGDQILSTLPDDNYAYANGTSVAAPFVAGVAALIKAKYDYDAAAIKRLIVGNADDITIRVPGDWFGILINQSVKRLNAAAALEQIEITTAQQLSNIRNNQYGNYRLANNISLSGWNWNPIPEFYGILNGNGKTISNLTINYGPVTSVVMYGLFGANVGEIFWMNFSNVYINSSIDHSFVPSFAGTVAGWNQGTIHSINITSGKVESNRYSSSTGGIAGYNLGNIIGCTVSMTVDGNGDVGGIAGSTSDWAMIYHCTVSNSTVSQYYVTANRSIGGIVGYSDNAHLEGNAVTNTVVKNRGDDGTSNRQPYMGKHVGRMLNSRFWYPSTSGVTLDAGNLGTNNRQNFGAANWPSSWGTGWVTSWYQYVGAESGNHCLR